MSDNSSIMDLHKIRIPSTDSLDVCGTDNFRIVQTFLALSISMTTAVEMRGEVRLKKSQNDAAFLCFFGLLSVKLMTIRDNFFTKTRPKPM